MKIVVIGGTGLIGAKVARILTEGGHEVIAASPSSGVDATTGEGLTEALAGADVVVDLANSPSFDGGPAMAFFQSAGMHLRDGERQSGVKHHVALSVVGTDRLQASGYFRAKAKQEEIIRGSGIPYTIVHATQFFEFVRSIADFSMVDGVVKVPPVLFQPIAAEDVALAVAAVAVSEPVNGLVEIAGPDTSTLEETIREALEHDGDRREVVVDDEATYFGVEVGERALIPAGRALLGSITFDKWLVESPKPKAN